VESASVNNLWSEEKDTKFEHGEMIDVTYAETIVCQTFIKRIDVDPFYMPQHCEHVFAGDSK